jgi:ribonuclease Z
MRLSQIDVAPQQLNAIFLTHIHGDHTEGLADVLMLRWYMKGSKLDIVCSSDAVSVFGFTNSCRNFVRHVADAFLQSGEIAERRSEDGGRVEGGPAQVTNVITFDPKDEPQVVWSSGDVKVLAIRSTAYCGPHILSGGHTGRERRDRWRCQQRCDRTAACAFDVRSGGEAGTGG